MTEASPGELHYLSLTDLAALLRRREVSPVEVTEAQLSRIEALDGELHSYVTVAADEALASARRAEREISDGVYRGALHGVPIGVKDLFWTVEAPAAGGMAMFRDFRPNADATAVSRLREAGAVIVGKQAMTEGAYSDYHPSVTPPVNPWDPALWPGISSSGPAVATAAGLSYGALASDTGGSIRWPCAATGLTGIKPTWGRVSRYGAFALAPSMDHVGPIARTATDAAEILHVVAGRDPKDPTSLCAASPELDLSRASTVNLRIGVDPAWCVADLHADVKAVLAHAVQTFGDLGARIIDTTAADVRPAVRDWTPLCAVEAATVHRSTYPSRRDEYGPVMASVLRAGHTVTGLDHADIEHRRRALRGSLSATFCDVDLLLAPVQPDAALSLTDVGTLGEQPHKIERLQRFTAPFDLTGHPTITLPGGTNDRGLPIAFQLIAAHLREDQLVSAAAAFQSATGWHLSRPRR